MEKLTLTQMVEVVRAKQILPEGDYGWRALKGGTQSVVGVMGTSDQPDLYVLKSNEPETVDAEAHFYRLYTAIPLLPKLHYVDPERRFLVYSHVPGTTSYPRGNKAKLLKDLMENMISHYVKPDNPAEYEWVEDPGKTMGGYEYTRGLIGTHIADEDHDLVRRLIERRASRMLNEGLYVLHGDFGVHNFLFVDGELSGVIDPIPVIGRKIFDLLYAFCSSPDDLTMPVLQEIYDKYFRDCLTLDELIEDMIIALYMRIGTCLTYHPEDLERYLVAWSDWISYS